jgi:hypothetical protein
MPDGEGQIPLAAAVDALREQLVTAMWGAQNQALRFAVSPIELTLQVTATDTGTVGGGIKWWLVTASAERGTTDAAVQTVKVTLNPHLYGQDGDASQIFIDSPQGTVSALDVQLDA